MSEGNFLKTKESVLSHIQSLFGEMEEEMAMSHQEKYALLEDLFDNSSDEDELRVAFHRWYVDHIDEIGFEHDVDELWNIALGGESDHDDFSEDEEEDEEERKEEM